ncbi:tRNA-guanine transglycosylase DpdA [uncultured Thiohalocapsa sp.]|mgnify:CR=1 FL=1|uniref:tRNA-guanine transglycosylase DpdA n=1 Tax=uncultured Thiohalocapsa sp. TaxID=768990 RepID=UPI0025DCBB7D|nr:tRNA-guanine transglycosylase DpdA [uncultured Thiohalocapsa sp.]
MRVLVLTSCTGDKAVSSPNQLTLEDFQQGAEHLTRREQALGPLTPAEDIYTGLQHQRLMAGVRQLRERAPDIRLDLHILSAGYGLVPGDRRLAPYEATFSGMGKRALCAWADQLGVPAAVRGLLAEPYDLGLVLLGNEYLQACRLGDDVRLGGPTLLICGANIAKTLPRLPRLRLLALSNAEAKRFSCALIGLKGELAARILRRLADGPALAERLFDPARSPLDLLADGAPAKAVRGKARPNPKVDQVITLPESWHNKPHRARLRYFIPEWDDLVDPDYDFGTDTHSGGAGDWSNEIYAHQMYPEPNYDGLLVSKVVAEKSKKKKERINQLGVHRFLRVPRDFPVMGDCGAFGYIAEDEPPYSTDEILDYYTRLDFDYGVSIDHLIVTSTEAQKQHRYQLTIHNAETFLREHQARGLPWTPIGAVQGWDPQSYADAARQYVAMGYQYIALGGLVRSPTKEILRVLDAVNQVVPGHVHMHLFGLARLGALHDFARLGVRSVDSASYLRRAWMGSGGQNYLTDDGFYTAIRIPEAAKSFRAKRMVSEGRARLQDVQKLEKACIISMHAFDAGKFSLETTLDTLMEYDHLITPDRPEDSRERLRRTLEARPWKHCSCDICRRDGIDVIIFRGNNRNRRRGFHNTYVFYRLLQRALAGEAIQLAAARPEPGAQLDLFEAMEATGT